tara:strand:+ start:4084 stop:4938 length:855 start_codon:yes stop_codon:yes gene_type:complete
MSPNSISFKSFSKVNLGLKILDLLPDNYHSIFTIMQEIDLHDTINFKKNLEKKINFSTDGAIIVPNDKTNLCYKAAKLILENYKTSSGINIHLTKNIPIGAGLGGGSSNAATVLLALNDIFNLKIKNRELELLAMELGCDVPFFINGGTQIAEGKGEILTPLNINISQYYFLLVFPSFQVSTKWAYSFFKKDLPNTFDSHKFRSFQASLDWKLFENDFENIIKSTYPEVVEIRRILEMNSSIFVSLSGSGSTMFGVFEDFLKADSAYQHLQNYHCCIVKPHKRN